MKLFHLFLSESTAGVSVDTLRDYLHSVKHAVINYTCPNNATAVSIWFSLSAALQ